MAAQPTRIFSYILIGAGILLFALNAFLGGSLNIALPLVFIMLGAIFFLLVSNLEPSLSWAAYLYIPGALFVALGLIFLLNVVTGDWNAWAYAWLLPVAALGLGLLLAREVRGSHSVHPVVNIIAWGLLLGGISLFAIFGAITGGLLIQVIAPILLILGGLALRWMRRDTNLRDSLRGNAGRGASVFPDHQTGLVEPLSAREVEVLRLLDAGLSNQQIAAKLNIAASTVKTHINNLYGKLGVQTRVQAVNRARELGLLEPLA